MRGRQRELPLGCRSGRSVWRCCLWRISTVERGRYKICRTPVTARLGQKWKDKPYLLILLSAFCLEDDPPAIKHIHVSASRASA